MGQAYSNIKDRLTNDSLVHLNTAERNNKKTRLEPGDIKEEYNDSTILKVNSCFLVTCNECLEKHVVINGVKFYICYQCEVYSCAKCLIKHKNHKNIVGNGQSIETEELIAHMLVENDREAKLMTADVLLLDQINVKCHFDNEDCAVNTLCLLGNKTLAMCDFLNNCIKILHLGSYELKRYIRLGSFPWGMTELTHSSMTEESAQISGQTGGLLAVTFPKINEIWFIDISKTPAERIKRIEPGVKGLEITYNNGKIFVLCRERPSPTGAFWYVCVLDKLGNVERYIKTDINLVLSLFPSQYKTPRMTIDNENVYVTTYWTNKVYCLKTDGKHTEMKTAALLDATGICSDFHTYIYTCSLKNDKIFRMDPNLTSCLPLAIDTDCLDSPGTLCFGKDKLFVANHYQSSSGNIVCVFALLV